MVARSENRQRTELAVARMTVEEKFSAQMGAAARGLSLGAFIRVAVAGELARGH